MQVKAIWQRYGTTHLRMNAGEKEELERFLCNSNNNSDNSWERFLRLFRCGKIRPGEEHNNSRRIIRVVDTNKLRALLEESGEKNAVECFVATVKKYIHVVEEEKDKRVVLIHQEEIGSVRVIDLNY